MSLLNGEALAVALPHTLLFPPWFLCWVPSIATISLSPSLDVSSYPSLFLFFLCSFSFLCYYSLYYCFLSFSLFHPLQFLFFPLFSLACHFLSFLSGPESQSRSFFLFLFLWFMFFLMVFILLLLLFLSLSISVFNFYFLSLFRSLSRRTRPLSIAARVPTRVLSSI